MSRGAILLVLAAILFFAFFGWKALGVVALLILLGPVLLLLAGLGFLLWFRRRVRKAALELDRALRQAQAATPSSSTRRDAIDTEGRDVTERPPSPSHSDERGSGPDAGSYPPTERRA